VNLPPPNDSIWRKLVTGETPCHFEFLATKIFLGRAQLVLFDGATEESINNLAAELRHLLEENITHPLVIKDLARLVGAGRTAANDAIPLQH
jgi:hypothetical protein